MCGMEGFYPEEFWSCADIAIVDGKFQQCFMKNIYTRLIVLINLPRLAAAVVEKSRLDFAQEFSFCAEIAITAGNLKCNSSFSSVHNPRSLCCFLSSGSRHCVLRKCALHCVRGNNS